MIEQARTYVGRTADLTMCITYYEIGRMIVEQEQKGKEHSEYGSDLLKKLSTHLTGRFGKGFSATNLKYARQFYQTYAPSIQQLNSTKAKTNVVNRQSPIDEFNLQKLSLNRQSMFGELPFKLSWTHYQVLTRIKNADERHFYEVEAINQQWSVRQLQRQYNSSLYERLALSRNKAEVMRLVNEGQSVEKSSDLLKSPLVLEFLGMDEKSEYSETTLESAIISHLQKFLLELGKGFLFEARQKRFSFDEQSFFVDLVFYNRLLQCYVIIDLKTDKMGHQDLGQMLMYVNYFDRYVKAEHEKPTVGILLCKEKNESIVQLTLPENSNIYASEYQLYLPTKSLLQQKLVEWTREFEEKQNIRDESVDVHTKE
ncbi:MAG: PDDEXK nuclease domain-containing protein [Nitrososphaerota archaeon]|nr:PDDEXK nuclease domain-containing protein [Nitrososphaerota archaeon]